MAGEAIIEASKRAQSAPKSRRGMVVFPPTSRGAPAYGHRGQAELYATDGAISYRPEFRVVSRKS